jgi:ApaG protein
MQTTTTCGVTITVRNQFQQGISCPALNSYVFGYEIEIKNENSFPVQLLRRFWNIFDACGNTREVEGAGVIGQQPLILPNTTFVYSSACDLKSPRGRMNGYYTMRSAEDHALFIVHVPSFQLEVPFVMN